MTVAASVGGAHQQQPTNVIIDCVARTIVENLSHNIGGGTATGRTQVGAGTGRGVGTRA